MKTSPLLSIGMIFKNEERCIERCLKSLEPLRESIPCELIMADTGTEDGSRAIAERYADEVFDFPWTDDFSAARNAVMDRCTGKWYFSIDCDEWLDENIAELVTFLNGKGKEDFAGVIIRDYSSAELEKSELYADFHAIRLVRMSTGQRYHGTIHESWYAQEPVAPLPHTILHHDGYFFSDPKAKKKKIQRNMKLLRQKLKEEPNDLRTLLQCIESGREDANLIQYIHTGVALVQKKCSGWQIYGPIILSHAVRDAHAQEMPELKAWIEYAKEQFAASIFIQIDLNFTAFMAAHDAEEWPDAIRYGEGYLKGLRMLRADHLPKEMESALRVSNLRSSNALSERTLLIGLANAYLQNHQGEQALKILLELEVEKLVPGQVRNAVILLCRLHTQTPLDAASALTAFYQQISQKMSDIQKQKACFASFDAVAAAVFTEKHLKEEKKYDGFHRPAYTAFLALANQCEAGRAAAIMTADSPEAMRVVLAKVEDWQALPIEALEHALQAGVAFPIEKNPVNIDVLDGLAAKMTHGNNLARQMALALPDGQKYPDLQSLYWAQSLVLAALHSFDWTMDKNDIPVSAFACPEKKKDQDEKPLCTPEDGLALLRRFVQVESAVLPLLYTPKMRTAENASLLPSMHRWGLYCIRALDALDSGNPQEYLAILRRGLKACPGEKDMVQFLLDRFLEDARPKTSPELLALAEKVRTILSAYDPDNPAVAAIRESPAYKQVAWLIEPAPAGQIVQ